MEENQQTSFSIIFEPVGKRFQAKPGENLADCALRAGIDLITSCNGLGICTSCRIEVLEGLVTPPTSTEEERFTRFQTNPNLRLACQTIPLSDLKVFIPARSLTQGQQLQVEGRLQTMALNTPFHSADIKISPPTLDDLRGDWERLRDACLEQTGFSPTANLDFLRELPAVMRENNYQVRIIVREVENGRELVTVSAPQRPYYGIAYDIGSTKIAGFLINLETGEMLHQSGFMNPQIVLGEDIINRLTHAMHSPGKARKLQTLLIDRINQHIQDICNEFHIDRHQIVDMVVVGNTVIHHLFCGLPIQSLGEAPYVPAIQTGLQFPAHELGINLASAAQIYLPPNIAGYVGADHTAAVIATHLQSSSQTAALIDIGTNTEISLVHNGVIYSCSCASGPAFEGAHIQDGMRAAPGAIDQVHIEDGKIHLSTIAGKNPTGICGSGILSIMSEMRRNEIIDRRGMLNARHPLVDENLKALVLHRNENGGMIKISRKDVNEVQLAKGAIRTGIETLCRNAGIQNSDLDLVMVAGAFGNYLDIGSAIEIGMFPDIPLERYVQIGNAAGVGARMLLLDHQLRLTTEQMVGDLHYIELTIEPDFNETFINALYMEKNVNLNRLI